MSNVQNIFAYTCKGACQYKWYFTTCILEKKEATQLELWQLHIVSSDGFNRPHPRSVVTHKKGHKKWSHKKVSKTPHFGQPSARTCTLGGGGSSPVLYGAGAEEDKGPGTMDAARVPWCLQFFMAHGWKPQSKAIISWNSWSSNY